MLSPQCTFYRCLQYQEITLESCNTSNQTEEPTYTECDYTTRISSEPRYNKHQVTRFQNPSSKAFICSSHGGDVDPTGWELQRSCFTLSGTDFVDAVSPLSSGPALSLSWRRGRIELLRPPRSYHLFDAALVSSVQCGRALRT